MTAPASIVLRGPAKTTLKRMVFSIPENATRRTEAARLAREVYRLCVKVGLNPLAVWSIAMHETGRFSTIADSDAWTTGLNPGGIFNHDLTAYARFTSGVEAARALVVHVLMYEQGKAGRLGLYRALDPGASRVVKAGYAGTASNLEEMRGKWATDPQWPEWVVLQYNHVRRLEVIDRTAPEAAHTYRFRQALLSPGMPNYSGLTLQPAFFAVHETANRSIGANAEMHRSFHNSGGGSENVSFHAVADDAEVIQLLPYDLVAWQAGDGYYGPGNRQAESLEICVNSDGDWLETVNNAAHYVADRLHARGWTIGHLRPGRHYDFSGKWCPTKLLNGEGGVTWAQFVAMVERYYQASGNAAAA